MDEALAEIALDLSGRPYLVYDVKMPAAQVGDIDVQLFHEFFQALCVKAGLNLHIRLLAGNEAHHCLEAIFKGFAKALDQATSYDPRIEGVLSTKGSLD
jgi:imidazoleglycerol-phosphate dehydratase